MRRRMIAVGAAALATVVLVTVALVTMARGEGGSNRAAAPGPAESTATVTAAARAGLGGKPLPAVPSKCQAQGGAAAVARPKHVRTVATSQTGWFSSPSLVDLDRDGKLEIMAPNYSTFVYSATGTRLATGTASKGRVYAPAVVTDLDGDSVIDIVTGGGEGTVAAYEFRGRKLRVKPGWPVSTCSGGQCPETRGLAAADLDHDGRMEIVATTTNTSTTGSQVFVFGANGKVYHPKGAAATSWPRYNTGSDAAFNGAGNHGYGTYGENVGIANLDDDPDLEIVVTYDNHQINVFNPDGTSVLASRWFTNRQNQYQGKRLGWGQMIRWLDPAVEEAHYHKHTGAWPDIKSTMWLQWTASPPSMGDLDGDGHAEVIGLPNAEMKEPYETQGYAVMAFDGAQNGGARSARRHAGFETPVLTAKPAVRGDGDWYPPSGIPAPTLVDLTGDGRPEIVSATPDGRVYAVSPDGKLLWKYNYARGAAKTFGSEVIAADLNRDGTPELVFGTYGPSVGAGRLVVMSATGQQLSYTRLPRQSANGNGVGIAAAPSIGDLDGDGTLEIVTSSIDHGLDVFTVPGSGTGCLPWPTGRGSTRRAGTAG
ncbi:VCBS repeat-containing protein [Micromonospora sp. AMSO31t]|uniref:FG-GAP repeat domain-containing protein n=1 Tax=Micromonospora sp. AMSO31t TaxID=2650566 RepID=UPI00124B329F|nr:VCBS repeat-containing protein [Micromonospora sp. AMSO31t]KAB1915699.1 VCBS repeat-containing protein [Micromonospora sp. AMSO31t]